MKRIKRILSSLSIDDGIVIGAIGFLILYCFVILPWHWELQCLQLFGVAP